MHDDEWWFVVKDIVEALTDTTNTGDYIKKMRQYDPSLAKGWGQIVTPFQLKLLGYAKIELRKHRRGYFASSSRPPPQKAELFKS